jgi:hypothetical protein
MVNLDPKGPPEEWTDLIVGLPDGTDFAPVKSLANTLLVGKPEERNLLKYAEIFRMVCQNPKASPWMQYACRAEEINGLRRAKGANMIQLASELSKLADEVSVRLSHNRDKCNLLGNVLYNTALIRRGLRQYFQAAVSQQESSAWYGLAGNREKQLVGLFAAEVEQVSDAFVKGNDEEIVRAIHALMAARDYVEDALPVYPDWMKDNAVLHVGWAVMMARVLDLFPFTLDCMRPVWGWEDSAASRFAHWAQVFRTWLMYRREQYEQVIQETPAGLPSSSADNAALTMRMLAALSHKAFGNTEEYKKILQSVADHQGPDGGVPMAVAKRLLASV